MVTFKGHISEPYDKSTSNLLRYLRFAFHSDCNNMHSHHQWLMFLFPYVKASTFYHFCLFLWVACGFLLLLLLYFFLILITVTKVKLALKRVWICILMSHDIKYFFKKFQPFNFIVHYFVLFLIPYTYWWENTKNVLHFHN